jgi:glycosyltransferase involved in cell wall biosynthesis
MYIQGFNTFTLLDRYFNHYVCVSNFVARFIRMTYGIKAPVIPAFIDLDRLPTVPALRDRPGYIIIHLKGDAAFRSMALAKLREAVARRVPRADLDNILDQPFLPHADFLTRLGSCRYLVSLSPTEGFGLVPLEAMALGMTIIGFDGFGGREYMRPGKNCLVTSYPDIEGVADRLVAVLDDPAFAERLAGAGRLTALQFGYPRFRAAWHDQFRRLLATA